MQQVPSTIFLIQERTLNAFIKTISVTNRIGFEIETTFIPLFGGMSQASLFRFTYENRHYVMRILPNKVSYVERERQIALMLHASQTGVGPSVFFVSPQKDALIMQFIDGPTTTPNTFQEDQAVRNFAQLLQRLHSSKVTAPKAISPFLRFYNFLVNCTMLDLTVASKIDTAKTIIENIKVALDFHPLPLVPTHLDLHSLNIMKNKDQFVLVDWVNGGLSDPFLDLATFTVFQNLDASRTELFLKVYFGRSPSKTEWARFHILLPIRPLVIAAAMLQAHPQASLSNHSLLPQPTFDDFLREQATGTLNWPPQIVGLIMLDHGISLADQAVFQESLNYLQK